MPLHLGLGLAFDCALGQCGLAPVGLLLAQAALQVSKEHLQ